jgi:hypothetical protein
VIKYTNTNKYSSKDYLCSSISYLSPLHSLSLTMQSKFSAWVPQTHDAWVPDGYIIVVGPDNEHYVVPEFMVEDLDQKFNVSKRELEINAFNAQGSVSNFLAIHNYIYYYRSSSGTGARDVMDIYYYRSSSGTGARDVMDIFNLLFHFY